jgi:hypothetical protein
MCLSYVSSKEHIAEKPVQTKYLRLGETFVRMLLMFLLFAWVPVKTIFSNYFLPIEGTGFMTTMEW